MIGSLAERYRVVGELRAPAGTRRYVGMRRGADGEVVIDIVKSIKPNLEKELLEKANAAIVKAAGTREFRIELEKVIRSGSIAAIVRGPPKSPRC